MGDRLGKQPEFEGEPTQVSQPFVTKDGSRTALLHRSFQLPAADQSKVSALLPRDTGDSQDAVRHGSLRSPAEGQPTGINLTSAGNAQPQNIPPASSCELPGDTGVQMTSLNSVTGESEKVTQLGNSQLPPERRVDDSTPSASAQEEIRSTLRDVNNQLVPSDRSDADLDETNEEARVDKTELPEMIDGRYPPELVCLKRREIQNAQARNIT